MIHYFFLKKLASSQGAPQENDAKFRFAIHPQGIRQFYDNCKISKCQIVAALTPVYLYRYSFFPATISSWNNLPFGIEKVDSVEGFKLKLKEHKFRSS